MIPIEIAKLRNRNTRRCSSWDRTGRNADFWMIPAGQSRVLADLRGPGVLTHLWMAQAIHERECLLRITWDNADQPSVLCPLGDFFGLGHGIVNSYQSLLFTASVNTPNPVTNGCALNCYIPMPFRKRALVELVNESNDDHMQYFYVDYETVANARELQGLGYFHTEFRRANPFPGWGPEITVNKPEANAKNRGRVAWKNNYVILETRGRGHYLGCNLSVTNIQGTWWGEGDDMIWVDGYKWPPDLHGTGSEDYLNQAWGMQPNAFLRNGSSIHEQHTGGYQTSYVFHIENPVRFRREIKVTIEHGHANHLGNEMSSVAYWYADRPTPATNVPPVAARMPVKKKEGQWVIEEGSRRSGKSLVVTPEMARLKKKWNEEQALRANGRLSPRHSRFVCSWQVSNLLPPQDIRKAPAVRLTDKLGWRTVKHNPAVEPFLINVHALYGNQDGLVYLGNRFRIRTAGSWILDVGHDGPLRIFIDGRAVGVEPRRINPCPRSRSRVPIRLGSGVHEIVMAFDTDQGMGWGICASFMSPPAGRKGKGSVPFPKPIVKSR